MDRIEANYKKETNIPKFFWRTLSQQRSDLMKLKNKFNEEEVSPVKIAEKS
ncbi:unnamed protein product [marine sediment metagenome]|uniref:Uncharacterized protein n=1 Tax=marine sediment metagenome TaxID=412755 RepID=X0ZNT1_9ZZZZ